MPQTAVKPNEGVLDRLFSRFQARRDKQQGQEPPEIDDPVNQGKKIPNPKYKKPADVKQNASSLYEGLFTPPARDPKNEPPRFNLSAEAVKKAADKMDFMAGIPEELQTEITNANGSLSLELVSKLINHAGRNAYSRAMEHGSSLTGQFVEQRVTHADQALPAHIRTHLAKSKATSGLNGDDPVVAEHTRFIAERITEKYPDATDEDIAELTKEYFVTMARQVRPEAFATNDVTKNTRGTPDDEIQDYGSYLSGDVTLEQAKQPVAASGSRS